MADSKSDLEQFRKTVQAWLEENFPKSLKDKGSAVIVGEGGADLTGDALTWKKCLGEKGWGVPTWPAEYGGGGLSQTEARVLAEEISNIGAFNPVPMQTGMGVPMVGPTILEYGTEEQKQRHIPPICRGEVRWCLGYSEPGAGSDLASLTTKAVDDGDHWTINGQKTWTSGADVSHWCGALVRTDPKAKKRDGISFLMMTMDQPGIETKPIKLIAGASPFCETFFTDAKAGKDDMLGKLNDGWSVGKRLLQHERQSQTGGSPMVASGGSEPIHEVAKRYVGTNSEGQLADQDLRTRLAKHLMSTKAQTLTLGRIAAESRGNATVTSAASIMKNAATSNAQDLAELTLEIMGYNGLGWDGDEFSERELSAVRGWLSGKAMSIYGGSFEVQNNIISKNILGLPETTQKG